MNGFCWFLLIGWLVTTAMLVFAQRRWSQALAGWKLANERNEQLLDRVDELLGSR